MLLFYTCTPAKEDDKVSDDSPELQQEETTVQEGKSSSAIVYPPLPKLKNNGMLYLLNPLIKLSYEMMRAFTKFNNK